VLLQTELENRELRLSYSRLQEHASMNDNNRRYFTPEQTVAILREHLIEGAKAFPICATSTTSTQRCFTSGRDSFLRTEQPLLKASSPARNFG
jgi:hypothetical protein